jgi:hypothetical protein
MYTKPIVQAQPVADDKNGQDSTTKALVSCHQ